jgi:hypothetical protein
MHQAIAKPQNRAAPVRQAIVNWKYLAALVQRHFAKARNHLAPVRHGFAKKALKNTKFNDFNQ